MIENEKYRLTTYQNFPNSSQVCYYQDLTKNDIDTIYTTV